MLKPTEHELSQRKICSQANHEVQFFENVNGMLSEISEHLSAKLHHNVSVSLVECKTYRMDSRTFFNRSLSKIEILFDSFLSELLLQYDIFYLIDAQSTDFIRYWYKTLAEIQFDKADYAKCISSIQRYRSFEYSFPESSYTSELTNKARKLSAIQHWFVIFHEIGHVLFRNNLMDSSLLEIVETRLRKIAEISCGNNEAMSVQVKHFIDTNAELIEECICDSYACSMAFESYKNAPNYTLDDIAEAVYLASQNMKILGLARGCANAVKIGKTSRYSVLRESFLANWIPILYTSSHFGLELNDIALARKVNTSEFNTIKNKMDNISGVYERKASFEMFQKLIFDYIDAYGTHSLNEKMSDEEVAELESVIEMLI
jgi:hypothetical protein